MTPFPTPPWELSSTDKMYHKKEQLEKDKELVQMHTDFSWYFTYSSMLL